VADEGHDASRLIDVGGFRLAIECAGTGTPTIVLEAGGMATSAAWDRLWPFVAGLSRACRYDRAGLGNSDRSPHPRTVRQMAAELRALLVRAKLSPPYVMVGHSFGVQIVRVFAGIYSAEIAGLVFVDGAHEDLFLRMEPYLSEEGREAFLASWDAIPNHPEDLTEWSRDSARRAGPGDRRDPSGCREREVYSRCRQ
jgi:pimeloyl-ACP methyl ester carboxylesterase